MLLELKSTTRGVADIRASPRPYTLTMPTYYVITIALRTATPTACVASGSSMLPRAWGVGITDWAFLATSPHHDLGVENQSPKSAKLSNEFWNLEV